MISRKDIITRAVDECLKDLYKYVQPEVEWDDLVKQNEIYSNKYKTWERYNHLKHLKTLSEEESKEFSLFPSEWKNESILGCIGPAPYEFYYLPENILKDICDNYINVYRLDSQNELLNTIHILKNYCLTPIIQKYIAGENGDRGYRGYENPDNIITEVSKILLETTSLVTDTVENISEKLVNKFFEFLSMAGKFYDWNIDLKSFNTSIYLGSSPNSNKEAVINNWKIYKNINIQIDEELINTNYYGEI